MSQRPGDAPLLASAHSTGNAVVPNPLSPRWGSRIPPVQPSQPSDRIWVDPQMPPISPQSSMANIHLVQKGISSHSLHRPISPQGRDVDDIRLPPVLDADLSASMLSLDGLPIPGHAGAAESVEGGLLGPILQWAGLKKKLRYSIPPTLREDNVFCGYLTVYEQDAKDLEESSSGGVGPITTKKAKRRYVAVMKDKAYMLARADSSMASLIFHLPECTIESSPLHVLAPPNVFAVWMPPGGLSSSGEDEQKVTASSGSLAAKGRYFIFVAGDEALKLKWVDTLASAKLGMATQDNFSPMQRPGFASSSKNISEQDILYRVPGRSVVRTATCDDENV